MAEDWPDEGRGERVLYRWLGLLFEPMEQFHPAISLPLMVVVFVIALPVTIILSGRGFASIVWSEANHEYQKNRKTDA